MTNLAVKLSDLIASYGRPVRIPSRIRRASARRRFWLGVESLETRTLLTSFLVGPNINITKSSANEAETSIAVNPTNTQNIFAIDTNTYQGHYSTDGGQTWTNSNMAGFTSFGFNDAQAVWDSFGNLFVTRMGNGKQIEVGISSDGGATFSSVQVISGTNGKGNDQPTLATGPSGVGGIPGAVWVSYEQAGVILAAGAAVNGLGSVGSFSAPETAPGSTNGDYGSVSVGPGGQVLVSYQDGLSSGAAGGEGPGTIFVNLDPDGLGAGGFNAAISAHGTNVGGTTSVPVQPGPFKTGGRTIDAEANLAYDDSGGAHNGRVYMVYTDRSNVPPPTNNNTDIFVIYSDNNGTNWSSPVRVNDDSSNGTSGATQFLPAIAVDQSTGDVGVSWYDTRNSGSGTTRDTYATVSVDAGASFLPNALLSAAQSNPLASAVGTFNSGDLDIMTYANGVLYRAWSDNSNSTGDNPAGAGNAFDIYTARLAVGNPPVVTGLSNQNSTEGTSTSFSLGSFSDSDGGPWSVDINWGDGKPDTKFAQGAPGSLGSKSHTYGEEGNYTATVTVTDSLGFTGSGTFQVATSDPAVVQRALAVSAVEGATFTGKAIAQFADPGGAEPNSADPSGTINNHYSVVSINWGDGSGLDTSTGTLSFSGAPGSTTDPFTLSGSHTYGEEGTYTITAIIDHEGVGTTLTSTVVVSDPAVVQGPAVAVSAVEGAAFSGKAIAQMTDPGGAEPNSADPSGTINNHYGVVSINWGDGTALDTSTGTLSFSGAPGSTTDPFTVSGSHTYGEEGTYTITTVIDHEGVDTTLTSTVTVSDPAVIPTGGFTLTTARGAPICDMTVATFTDPGGPEPNPFDPTGVHYTADINWGDGGNSSGTISFDGVSTFTVKGDHTYSGNGTYTVTVTIHHETAPDAVTTSSVTVQSVAIGQGPCDANTLLIGGTLADDKILVIPLGTTAVQVFINSEPVVTVPLSSFASIAVYAQAGNDNVEIAGGVLSPAFLFGEDGNDRLKAGGGNTMLVGGAGNDTLLGGNARNVLLGGTGSDQLIGGNADDLLVGGSVDFEDPTNCDNDPKLCALFNAWINPAQDYSTRATAVGALLAGHVSNDDAVDTLNGCAGQDLFYISADDLLRGTVKLEIVVTV